MYYKSITKSPNLVPTTTTQTSFVNRFPIPAKSKVIVYTLKSGPFTRCLNIISPILFVFMAIVN